MFATPTLLDILSWDLNPQPWSQQVNVLPTELRRPIWQDVPAPCSGTWETQDLHLESTHLIKTSPSTLWGCAYLKKMKNEREKKAIQIRLSLSQHRSTAFVCLTHLYTRHLAEIKAAFWTFNTITGTDIFSPLKSYLKEFHCSLSKWFCNGWYKKNLQSSIYSDRLSWWRGITVSHMHITHITHFERSTQICALLFLKCDSWLMSKNR